LRLAGAAVVAAVLTGAAGALAASPHDQLAASARLQGTFQANGTVLIAVGTPGERRGERVARTWQFIPSCPAGACSTVQLLRQRGTHTDDLLLHQARPGYYTGGGTFPVAVRCAGRVYPGGELARYTITLTITTAQAEGGSVIATGFTATYRNPVRIGRTRCFSAPSYDKAHYVGVPMPPAPTGATRSERSTRSTTGS
jgi:hypothetical protein